MKNTKLIKLKTMLNFYYSELNSLTSTQYTLKVELLNKKETLEKVDNSGIKYPFGATIPTCLGALTALTLPVTMSFSILSLISATCITLLSAYIAIPNYIKWVKDVKECNCLDREIKNLTTEINNNSKKIEIVQNKINLITKLIESYEVNPNLTLNEKTQTTDLASVNNIKTNGIER